MKYQKIYYKINHNLNTQKLYLNCSIYNKINKYSPIKNINNYHLEQTTNLPNTPLIKYHKLNNLENLEKKIINDLYNSLNNSLKNKEKLDIENLHDLICVIAFCIIILLCVIFVI
jgi:hypothetical protein